MSRLSYYKTVVKNIFLLFLILFKAVDIKAQNKFGILAGAGKTSLNKLLATSDPFTGYSSRNSYWGGITAGFPLGTGGLSISTAATYNKKGYDYSLKKDMGATNTLKDSSYSQNLNYIDINLLLLKKFSLDERTGFFIGGGASVSLFMSGTEQTTLNYFGNTVPSVKSTNGKLQVGNSPGAYKRAFPSFIVAGGVEFNRFSVWVNYTMPLDYYYLDKRNQLQHRIKTFGVSASYALFTGKQKEKEKKEKKEKNKDKEKNGAKEKSGDKEKKEKTEITNDEAKKDSVTDTDGDGIPDINDKCPGHKGIAKYGGCPVPDADGDGIDDDDDKCPMVEGPLSNSGCPLFSEPGQGMTKDTMRWIIYFEPGKSELKTEGFVVLNQVIKLLKNNKKLVVQFNGHTDNVGSVEANSIRAFSRAMVCVDYVASYFIERRRLTAAAFSNKKPAADLNDPLLQWKNRRVEVYVFEKDQ